MPTRTRGYQNLSALSTHVTDTVDAHDASAISFVPDGSIAATDTQAAIVEVRDDADATAILLTTAITNEATARGDADVTLAGDLSGHFNATAGAHAATAISFAPTGTIAATTVQAAIAEVASEAQPLVGGITPSGGSRALVIPGVILNTGASTTATPAKDTLIYRPFELRASKTLAGVFHEVTSVGSSSCKTTIAIYSADAAWQPTSRLWWAEYDTSSVGGTGVKSTTGLSVSLPPGRYLTLYETSGNPTTPTIRVIPGTLASFGINPAMGSSLSQGTMDKSSAYASPPADPGTAWDTPTYASSVPSFFVFLDLA